jgi:hypothetical protein
MVAVEAGMRVVAREVAPVNRALVNRVVAAVSQQDGLLITRLGVV